MSDVCNLRTYLVAKIKEFTVICVKSFHRVLVISNNPAEKVECDVLKQYLIAVDASVR